MDSTEGKEINSELKIIVIGNSNTGKTSFVNKWTKGTFTDNYKATVVSEFSFKVFQFKDKYYRIQFSKNSHGCIVLCDITNKETLNDTLKWKESVDESTRFIDGDIIPSVLVQNKIDLVDEESLKDEEDIKKFAEDNKYIGYFRTSVKMGVGVDECMEFLITNILERIAKCSVGGKNPLEKDRQNLVLEHKKIIDQNNPNKATGGCC